MGREEDAEAEQADEEAVIRSKESSQDALLQNKEGENEPKEHNEAKLIAVKQEKKDSPEESNQDDILPKRVDEKGSPEDVEVKVIGTDSSVFLPKAKEESDLKSDIAKQSTEEKNIKKEATIKIEKTSTNETNQQAPTKTRVDKEAKVIGTDSSVFLKTPAGESELKSDIIEDSKDEEIKKKVEEGPHANKKTDMVSKKKKEKETAQKKAEQKVDKPEKKV